MSYIKMRDVKNCQKCNRNKKAKYLVELRGANAIYVCTKCKKRYYKKNDPRVLNTLDIIYKKRRKK